MTPHQLITAPWEERNKPEVAKCWPEVQKFYGLPDLPHGALYAGLGTCSENLCPFSGWALYKCDDNWRQRSDLIGWTPNEKFDRRHYARPRDNYLNPKYKELC